MDPTNISLYASNANINDANRLKEILQTLALPTGKPTKKMEEYASEIKHLISLKEVDPSANNNLALRVTIARGFFPSYAEIVRLLLADSRVDPSVDNNWVIREASKHGYKEIVKLLLRHPKVDPTANDNDAIQWASKNGHIEVVNLLLRKG